VTRGCATQEDNAQIENNFNQSNQKAYESAGHEPLELPELLRRHDGDGYPLMLSPEQAAKLREKLFGGGIALPTMGGHARSDRQPSAARRAGRPPRSPDASAPAAERTHGRAPEGRREDRGAEDRGGEERGIATGIWRSIMPPAAASNLAAWRMSPATPHEAETRRRRSAVVPGAKPPTIGHAWTRRSPRGVWARHRQAHGQPACSPRSWRSSTPRATAARLAPGALGRRSAPEGARAGPPPPHVPAGRDRAAGRDDGLPEEGGSLDEQAAELAAHGKLREAVLTRNAAEEAEQMQAEADAREKERLDYVQGQISCTRSRPRSSRTRRSTPDHFWKNKGDGAKVGAMVAMFFAGFGNKGQAEMLMKSIEGRSSADVDAQKTNIAQGWRGLEAQRRSIFQSASAPCRTSARRTRATKASYWEGIALTARSHAAETASEEEKVNAEKLALAAQFEADKYKNEIQTGAEQKFAAIEAAKANAAAAAAANELKKQNGEDRKALLAIAVKDIEVNGGKLAFSPDGAPGIIRDGVFVPAQGTAAGSGAQRRRRSSARRTRRAKSPVAGNAEGEVEGGRAEARRPRAELRRRDEAAPQRRGKPHRQRRHHDQSVGQRCRSQSDELQSEPSARSRAWPRPRADRPAPRRTTRRSS
jgi:hypothetical protein